MQATYAEQVVLRQGLHEALAQRGQLQGVHLRPITDPDVRLSGCLAVRQHRVKPGEPYIRLAGDARLCVVVA